MTTRRELGTLAVLFTCGSALAANACGSSSEDASATGSSSGGGTTLGAPDASAGGMNGGGSGANGGGSGANGGSSGANGGSSGASGTNGGGSGALGPSGISCASSGECAPPWPYCDTAGGQCVQCLTDTNCGNGFCDLSTHGCIEGDASTTGGGAALTGGPRFPGAGGFAGVPLQPGFGPQTAGDCPAASTGGSGATQVRDQATLCFYGEDPTPAATIEQVVEVVDGLEYIHLRVTFNPTFADNTYGAGSVGWDNEKGGIRDFDKLVGSDHLELLLTDCSGDTVMQFKVDYISKDPDAPSGYGTLGVTGGDGKMITGDPKTILAVATSLDRNLNGCGYSDYVVDSPATDDTFAANPEAPNWDYRVVYEVWVDAAAFEDCFGQAYVESVHASPSKAKDDTLLVDGEPCPPDWNTPYCETGEMCGDSQDGGSPCPQNYTPYADCPTECVPIPFAGYPDRAPCPDGYVLDLASEGQYCLPEGTDVCP